MSNKNDVMKNFSLSLMSKRDFDDKVNKAISDNPSQGLYVNITKKPKKRSLPANAVYYAWIPAISEYTGMFEIEVRNTLKLDFGLNIVLSDEFTGQKIGTLLEKLGFFNLSREEIIGYMGENNWIPGVMEIIPVTSLMSTKQHNQMRDEILHFYQQMGVGIDYDNN